jgi:hypothetical protein
MKQLAISALALTALACPASAAVIISTGATSHMHCAAGVCTPKSKNAVLNVSQLQTLLASSDVTVNTGSSALSIAISSPLTWASTSRLTLNAAQGVSIKAAVVVEGTGGLTVAASGGALNFYPGGSISFWDNASSLIIGANTYTLVSDVGTLASSVTASPSGFYALAKDYDATGDGTYGDSPVTAPLTGTFEGLGHTISNLAVAATGTSSSVGFFAQVSGTARDIAFTNAGFNCGTSAIWSGVLAGINSGTVLNASAAGTLTCTGGDGVGGLVGQNAVGATIAHASATVSLFGGNSLGGLAGTASGTISFSTASPSLSAPGASNVGGLVGLEGGTITDSHATAYDMDTATASDVGGLVGYLDGTIERCSAANTFGIGAFANGGLVGVADTATIDSSFATGQVQARRGSGGLVGSASNVTLTNSYSTATVNKNGGGGPDDLGGLIGTFNGGTIASSWSSGGVANKKREVRGGFVGSISNTATVTAGYWDLSTSGINVRSQGAGNIANFPGITGLKTVEFQAGLPAGFDPAIWAENASINNGYPYLIANPPQ